MTDEISFSNMDSWKGGGGKFGLTFKQIILMHINRCVQNGSVEFRGGYNKPISHGNFTTYEYVPDSRDVYNNSVKMLRALLLGYFDKQMTEKDKELQENFEKNYESYLEQTKKEKDVKREWYEFKVEWHIELFEQLIMLSKRLNFFEEESAEDEM